MSLKDDPLEQQHHTPGGRTLFLNRDNMLEARENFWRAYLEVFHQQPTVHWREYGNPTEGELVITQHVMTTEEARAHWDISWAAAIAAFSFVMEGRTEPR